MTSNTLDSRITLDDVAEILSNALSESDERGINISPKDDLEAQSIYGLVQTRYATRRNDATGGAWLAAVIILEQKYNVKISDDDANRIFNGSAQGGKFYDSRTGGFCYRNFTGGKIIPEIERKIKFWQRVAKAAYN